MTSADLSFPARQIETYFRRRIAAFDQTALQLLMRLEIRFCHVTTTGEQAPWAGFGEALHEVLNSAAAHEQPSPMLFFGLHAADRVRANPRTRVMKWPGATYLRYDVGDVELLAAVRATIEGAAQAVRSDLLPTAAEIRDVMSGVRHWLDNRRRNTAGAMIDFAAAASGEQKLHESYLSPVSPISPEHQESLVLLRNLEPAIAFRGLKPSGLAEFDATLDEFVRCWEKLEQTRSDARRTKEGVRSGHLCKARDQYGRIAAVLLKAIAILDELDCALVQATSKHNG